MLPLDFGEESVNSGESASLSCSVTKGDLPIKISWFHNNERIESGNDGIVISRVSNKLSTLSIDNVYAGHSGTYQCVAGNIAGNASFSAELHVNGTNTRV